MVFGVEECGEAAARIATVEAPPRAEPLPENYTTINETSMPIIKWEPLNELGRFFDERPYISMFPKLGWDLAVDMYEEDDNIVAKMSLPGVKPEELDITVDEDSMTVSGNREEEKETEKKDYYSKEIRRGSFSRTVGLPKSVNASKAGAEYMDGVLKITMPAVKGKEAKSVKVNVTTKK